jgi:predicted MFS family arabinose efflux permease
VLGPSVAGLLISSVGVTACFVVSAVSYVPFIGVALWILPRRVRDAPNAPGSVQRGLLDGVVDVLREPQLRGALLTVLTTSLFCAPLVTFVSVLVKDVFHGGAGHFSSSVAAFGVGGLLGALILLGMGPRVDRRRLSSGFALAYAVVVAVSAASPWFWVIPPLLVLGGASMTISNTVANSVLQATADPRRLGQTVSLYMLAMRGGISLGALLTGAAASLVGVQCALLINGLVAVTVQLLGARIWAKAPPTARATGGSARS